MASNRKLNEKAIREIQMKNSQGGRGPGSRFGGLKEKPKDVKGTIKKLLTYIAFSKKIFIPLILVVILSTLCSLSTNVFVKNVVASLGEYNMTTNVWTTPFDKSAFVNNMLFLIIVYVVYSILEFLGSLLSAYLSSGLARKMRSDLFEKIVKLPISYTDSHPHGDIMSRMTNDVSSITDALSSSLTSLISGVITLFGAFFIMLYYSPLLTLVTMIVLVLSLVFTLIMSKYMRPLFTKQQRVLGLLNAQTEEMVTGCKTVIAYNHQDIAEEEFNEFSNDLKNTAIKAQIWGQSMGPIMNFIGNVGYFLICYFGAIFVLNGIGKTLLGAPLTVAIIVMFVSTSKQFTRPINQIAQLYSTLITALAASERIFTLMEQKPEVNEGKEVFDVNNVKGDIDFEHVMFSYDKKKTILNDFSLEVYSGHKIALVGATGSGKTTIVNLLLRFYDIDSGTIKIDGININDISKKDLRDAISIVLQDATLFGDTVENNVRYGNDKATKEEFENALKMAHCYGFVNRLPQKEKTVLSEGATNISQGQRQLLTIARAILANPKILILDEATSSVDTRTEKKIQDAMINLMKNRTSIIIAHRLSTIQDADLIVVLDQGHIVETGNHQSLLALNGAYAKLYNTQYSGLNT